MATAPTAYQNSPTSGTSYAAAPGYQFIPNSGTSVTVTVKAWTGANGTGSLVSVTSITAKTRDVTTASFPASFTQNSGNTAQVISSSGTNSSDVFAAGGSYTGSAIGSLSLDATYTGAAIIPASITFTPASGGIGSSVAISGVNFTGATDVSFNGTSASFTVNSDTSITATVPAGATTGTITVSNPSGTGTSAATFTVAGMWVNTGTPASPVWTAAQVFINTGTPASPVWTAPTDIVVNTGTPASPVWTSAS